MKVLGLAAYPELGASTRFRMSQYRGLLNERGIELELVTFLDDDDFGLLFSAASPAKKARMIASATLRHARALARKRPDVVWVQREASLVGPEIAEKLMRAPMVYDVDDAIWLPPPSEGAKNPAWSQLLRSRGKVHRLARAARHVIAGSSHLAAHLRTYNAKTTVVPTVPSRVAFTRRPASHPRLRIGWIGSHSTAPFLRMLLPVFERLRREGHTFDVLTVGGDVGLPWKPFRLHEELSDLHGFDIGVAPMTASPWTDGKCGFKQLEYMAVGIPCVTSPWAGADFIRDGQNALVARHADEWFAALARLLTDATLRKRLGDAGRALVAAEMCAESQVDRIAEILKLA